MENYTDEVFAVINENDEWRDVYNALQRIGREDPGKLVYTLMKIWGCPW
jgi:hypothetical protein